MGCCFHFGSGSSFLLELFLCSSPVAYWGPTDMWGSSFSVIWFCFFILFMGFSRQEYWHGLQFPSPVDHLLLKLCIMTSPSWVTLHSLAYSFTELDKLVIHVISLFSFLWLWSSFCLPSDGWGLEAHGHFLMRGTSSQENWFLFWWVGPCSLSLQPNFILMGGAVRVELYNVSVERPKNYHPRLFYPEKLSFIYEREIKVFIDKQKLRELTTKILTLQTTLKVQHEMKAC